MSFHSNAPSIGLISVVVKDISHMTEKKEFRKAFGDAESPGIWEKKIKDALPPDKRYEGWKLFEAEQEKRLQERQEAERRHAEGRAEGVRRIYGEKLVNQN